MPSPRIGWFNFHKVTGEPVLLVFNRTAHAAKLEKMSDAAVVAEARAAGATTDAEVSAWVVKQLREQRLKFSVEDPDAWIDGLSGGRSWDGASTQEPVFDQPVDERLLPREERDMAVRGASGPVVLHDGVLGDIAVMAEGFDDRVVWNPGPGQTLPDVPSGLEAQFVCIEPVVLNPVVLPAGQTWTASHTVTLA